MTVLYLTFHNLSINRIMQFWRNYPPNYLTLQFGSSIGNIMDKQSVFT